MARALTFVYVTHPGQGGERHKRRKGKSNTSSHHMKRKHADLIRQKKVEEPCPTLLSSVDGVDEDRSAEDEIEDIVVLQGGQRCDYNGLNSTRSGRELFRTKTVLPTRPLYSKFGNVKIDHFDLYPSQALRRLTYLLDYYVQSFGPRYIWRPQMISSGSVEHFVQDFFQYSVQQPVILELLLGLCQAQLERDAAPTCAPSVQVTQHRGRALRLLQQRLKSSEGEVDNASLIAVCSLLTYDVLFADWTSFEANLKGFRQMIKLRQGVDKLGMNGWFASVHTWVELRWAGHLAQLAAARDKKPRSLTYPSHPFTPGLCKNLSRLPQGFVELALSGDLSLEVVRHLLKIAEWTTQYEPSFRGDSDGKMNNYYRREIELATQTINIVESGGLKSQEHLLCNALVAFITSFEPFTGSGRHPRRVTETVRYDLLPRVETSWGSAVWTALVLAAAEDSSAVPPLHRWVLLDRVIDEREDGEDWERLLQIVRNYLWTERLEKRWHECWQARLRRKERRKPKVGH